MRLVLATANPHKATEIAAILGPAVELVPRPGAVPDVVEDAATLEGNARLKAVAVCEATGEPAVADDTGLEVDALDGRPGVRSARYAGEQGDSTANVARLLAELEGVAIEQRTARFRTVALVRWPDGTEIVAEGVVEGHITEAPAGQGGFGYDPVFVPQDRPDPIGHPEARTFAQLPAEDKDAVSHRGIAFRTLADALAGPVGLP